MNSSVCVNDWRGFFEKMLFPEQVVEAKPTIERVQAIIIEIKEKACSLETQSLSEIITTSIGIEWAKRAISQLAPLPPRGEEAAEAYEAFSTRIQEMFTQLKSLEWSVDMHVTTRSTNEMAAYFYLKNSGQIAKL